MTQAIKTMTIKTTAALAVVIVPALEARVRFGDVGDAQLGGAASLAVEPAACPPLPDPEAEAGDTALIDLLTDVLDRLRFRRRRTGSLSSTPRGVSVAAFQHVRLQDQVPRRYGCAVSVLDAGGGQ